MTTKKKESKGTPPKVSDELAKIGQELLKSHPDMTVIHMTSDGNGFFLACDAATHAAKLKDKTVYPLEKEKAE